MNIFISWSGRTSMEIANLLKDWIPKVIQSAKPYYTPSDIEKGTKWESEINRKLNECLIGLICITEDNTEKPWILFEAGALSNKLEKSKVCPILFGLKKSQLKGPLATFQLTEFNKSDFLKLLKSINNSLEKNKIDDIVLFEVFEAFYPKLETEINTILNSQDDTEPTEPLRSDRDILEEILNLTRKQYNYPPPPNLFEETLDALYDKDINENKSRYADNSEIQIGDLVKHQRFGLGKVLDISKPNTRDTKITIKFKDSPTKTLLLRFAKLTKLS